MSASPMSGASTPGATTSGATTPDPEMPPSKGRNRLIRGLQRMSSSPSITSLRRSRSHSAPYRSSTRGALSCVSLASAAPPQIAALRSAGLATPQPSQLGPNGSSTSSNPSRPVTPAEFVFPETDESELAAVRRVENARPTSSNAGTAPLPAGLARVGSSSSCLGQKKTHQQNQHEQDQKDQQDQRDQQDQQEPPPFQLWDKLPYELKIWTLSFLQPKELVQASRVSRSFYGACLDGQLWISLDASEFYQEIPAESLSRIIVAAGPFIKDLNLRGCVQMEHYKRADVIVKACRNLINATLEGCRNFQKSTLHSLLESNSRLVHLNLTGLAAVSNRSCRIVSESCPQLRTLNISWCGKVDSRGLESVIRGCANLEDLRAGEVRGFDSIPLAEAIFETNKLQRLLVSGCAELTDESLRTMMHGVDPPIDILTGRPLVPPRKLRHLDLSQCTRLSDAGVRSMAYLTPELEGLQLSRCRDLSDAALEPILASCPRLTHLELEDLPLLTNAVLSEHLVKAPCASKLEHLSLSYCETLGDVGILPVMQRCVGLRSVELDNTRASDLVLAEAATMVSKRSKRSSSTSPPSPPEPTLRMVVYDCANITWTGIREVLYRNSHAYPAANQPGLVAYPTEAIMLKCFYGFQMTVDEHQKRVLSGKFAAASRLEKKWAEYMQANEEAGTGGSGHRRRRRRAREAEAMHLDEELGGRQRSRTVGGCSVM